MKTHVRHASLLAAGVLLMSAPLVAHHGDAGRYDENPFVITGTIVEIKMTNPHSILVFDATDANGKVVRWQAEMSGGQALARQYHWNKDFPKIGDKITLTGRKVKNGAPYISMAKRANIILTDTGKEIYVGQTPPGSPIPKSDSPDQ
jgi:uncharacterized protein DUF6152